MKKAVLVLSVLAVLIAVIAVAGCVGDNGNSGNSGAAGTSSGNTGSSSNASIVGTWTCVSQKAHDVEKATEVVIKSDGTGTFTYYKKNVQPTTNTLKWETTDDANVFHITVLSATDYVPTAYYTISSDGKTLEGSTAKLTRA